MQNEAPRKMIFNLNNEATYDNGLICGGTVEIFVEPILPQPMLYLFGGGHVSIAVAKAASSVGFAVSVIDDRETFANAERFPMAQKFFTTYEEAFDKIHPSASTYLVIVTRGHKEDMRVLAWAVRTDARYIGMIGSKRKVLSVYKALEQDGYRPDEFERVYAPTRPGDRRAVTGRDCGQHRCRADRRATQRGKCRAQEGGIAAGTRHDALSRTHADLC